MQAGIRSNAFVHSLAIVAFIFSICNVAAELESNIQLNEDALAFAAKLIKEGRFIADHKGAWTEHRPSADEENEFIRLHGFAAYAKWHLGIDKRFHEHTKAKIQISVWQFQGCSSLRVACGESQSPRVQLLGNLKRGDEFRTSDGAIKKRRISAALQNVAVTANIDLSLAFCSRCPSNSSPCYFNVGSHM